MKIGKHPKLMAYSLSLGILAGTLAESLPSGYALAQEQEQRQASLIALAPNEVKSPLCGYYIEQEYTDGFSLPKIIAYYESKEGQTRNEPSCFALRNEDGFTYNFFSMPETRCVRCHKEPKEKEYLFLKADRKPI